MANFCQLSWNKNLNSIRYRRIFFNRKIMIYTCNSSSFIGGKYRICYTKPSFKPVRCNFWKIFVGKEMAVIRYWFLITLFLSHSSFGRFSGFDRLRAWIFIAIQQKRCKYKYSYRSRNICSGLRLLVTQTLLMDRGKSCWEFSENFPQK